MKLDFAKRTLKNLLIVLLAAMAAFWPLMWTVEAFLMLLVLAMPPSLVFSMWEAQKGRVFSSLELAKALKNFMLVFLAPWVLLLALVRDTAALLGILAMLMPPLIAFSFWAARTGRIYDPWRLGRVWLEFSLLRRQRGLGSWSFMWKRYVKNAIWIFSIISFMVWFLVFVLLHTSSFAKSAVEFVFQLAPWVELVLAIAALGAAMLTWESFMWKRYVKNAIWIFSIISAPVLSFLFITWISPLLSIGNRQLVFQFAPWLELFLAVTALGTAWGKERDLDPKRLKEKLRERHR